MHKTIVNGIPAVDMTDTSKQQNAYNMSTIKETMFRVYKKHDVV